MIREAFQLLFDIHQKSLAAEVVYYDGLHYFAHNGNIDLVCPPRAKPVACASLHGVVSYLRSILMAGAAFDATTPDMAALAVIIEPEVVAVVTKLHPTLRDRELLLGAKATLPTHNFGRELSQEDGVVYLKTCFEQTPELETLLQLIGNLRAGAITTLVDDGVTQQVTVAAGVKRGSSAEAPSIINLRPYRTFAEVDQPESPFVLRLRGGEDVPRMVLYPTADVKWRALATASIERFITEGLGELAEKILILR